MNAVVMLSTALLFLVLYQKTFFKRLYVVSSVNNRRYLVREGKTQVESANRLAKLMEKKKKLCDFLSAKQKYKTKAGVRRLLERRNVEIEEKSMEYDEQAAYSINKGERIGICLKNKAGKYEDENTMFFVLMHELAHIMSKKYGHDEEFWNNFAVLVEAAVEAGLYKYQRYDKEMTTFCGHVISHTPYKK